MKSGNGLLCRRWTPTLPRCGRHGTVVPRLCDFGNGGFARSGVSTSDCGELEAAVLSFIEHSHMVLTYPLKHSGRKAEWVRLREKNFLSATWPHLDRVAG
jgi:hypothetical protein